MALPFGTRLLLDCSIPNEDGCPCKVSTNAKPTFANCQVDFASSMCCVSLCEGEASFRDTP
eukprot:scaffold6959_cov103-Cylindrotheca_fusiformis.AAC.1